MMIEDELRAISMRKAEVKREKFGSAALPASYIVIGRIPLRHTNSATLPYSSCGGALGR